MGNETQREARFSAEEIETINEGHGKRVGKGGERGKGRTNDTRMDTGGRVGVGEGCEARKGQGSGDGTGTKDSGGPGDETRRREPPLRAAKVAGGWRSAILTGSKETQGRRGKNIEPRKARNLLDWSGKQTMGVQTGAAEGAKVERVKWY